MTEHAEPGGVELNHAEGVPLAVLAALLFALEVSQPEFRN
jgi:hypothetical protein